MVEESKSRPEQEASLLTRFESQGLSVGVVEMDRCCSLRA